VLSPEQASLPWRSPPTKVRREANYAPKNQINTAKLDRSVNFRPANPSTLRAAVPLGDHPRCGEATDPGLPPRDEACLVGRLPITTRGRAWVVWLPSGGTGAAIVERMARTAAGDRVAVDLEGAPTVPATPAARRSPLWYLALILRSPRRGLDALVDDPGHLRVGLTVVVLKAAVYTAIIALLYLGGVPTMVPSWIAIPAENYYLWEIFFIGAVTIGCWILAAGVVHLLARAVGGGGTFERVLAASAFAVVIPSMATIIPDTMVGTLTTAGILDPLAWAHTSVTPGAWRTVIWAYLALYLVALLVLFPLAAAAAHRIRGWRAIAVGLAGAVVYQGVYFIFIR
jgi:hypothetical protein